MERPPFGGLSAVIRGTKTSPTKEDMADFAPTSPELPADSGIVKTQKQFSDALTTDLTDAEIKHGLRLIIPIKRKHEEKFFSKFGDDSFTLEEAEAAISEFQDEISYTLAVEAHILATVDAAPIFEGLPLVIEWMGVIPGHNLSKYGFDHEKKEFEVKRATERGEDFLGQRGESEASKAKRRHRNQ